MKWRRGIQIVITITMAGLLCDRLVNAQRYASEILSSMQEAASFTSTTDARILNAASKAYTGQTLGFFSLAAMLAAVLLLVAKFDTRKPNVRALLPEATLLVILWQSLRDKALPELALPVAEQLDAVLRLADLSAGPHLWVSAPAFACAWILARDRQGARSIAAVPALIALPFTDVGRVVLLASASLLLISLWAARNRSALPPFDATRWSLLLGCGIAIAIPGTDAVVWRASVGAALATSLLLVAVEALARKREEHRQSSERPGEPIIVDGKETLNPFIIPNEARVRVVVALVFGLVALAYHAQIIGAAAAAAVARGAGGILANTAVTAAILVAPLVYVWHASRPGGTCLFEYAPGERLRELASPALPTQFYLSSLRRTIEDIIEAWRPGQPFRVYLTKGASSPGTGAGPSGHFIELPSETLSAFFAHARPGSVDAHGKDMAARRVTALIAHEIAHVVHGDPLLLAIATSICSAAALVWLVSGPVLALSSISPDRAILPAARYDVWALMAALAVISYTTLLRAAQRKIELLADARVAIHLRSLAPVHMMVALLLQLSQAEPSSGVWSGIYDGLRAPVRLGATSAVARPPALPSLARRIAGWIDTHEPLEQRLKTLQQGMHALNAPDAGTLFVLSAMSWTPYLLGNDIGFATWSPTLITSLMGVAGFISYIMEHYLLAALALSPSGSTNNRLGWLHLRLGYIGGSVTGILTALLLNSDGMRMLRSVTTTLVHGASADWKNIRDPEIETAATAAIYDLPLVVAFIFTGMTLYIACRLLVVIMLQRLARSLCVAYPDRSPSILVLAPHIGWAALVATPFALSGLAMPVLAPWIMKLSAELYANISYTLIVIAVMVVSVAFGATLCAIMLLRRRVNRHRGVLRCCTADVSKDRWVVATLYGGCPMCGRNPLRHLVTWSPRSTGATAGLRSLDRRILLYAPVALVAASTALVMFISSVGGPLDRYAPREALSIAFDTITDRNNLLESAHRANLAKAMNVTASDILRSSSLRASTNKQSHLSELMQAREAVSDSGHMAKEAVVLGALLQLSADRLTATSSLLLDPYKGNPARPISIWSQVVNSVTRGNLTEYLSKVSACPTAPSTEAIALERAICGILQGKGAEALDALHVDYDGEPVYGEIGVLWGAAALVAHDELLAISKASAYAALCRRNPASCPAKVRMIMPEIVTLAVAHWMHPIMANRSDTEKPSSGSSIAAAIPKVTRRDLNTALREGAWADHMLVVDYLTAIAAELGASWAIVEARVDDLDRETLKARVEEAMRAEQFGGQPDLPLGGEPYALGKPVTYLTKFF